MATDNKQQAVIEQQWMFHTGGRTIEIPPQKERYTVSCHLRRERTSHNQRIAAKKRGRGGKAMTINFIKIVSIQVKENMLNESSTNKQISGSMSNLHGKHVSMGDKIDHRKSFNPLIYRASSKCRSASCIKRNNHQVVATS